MDDNDRVAPGSAARQLTPGDVLLLAGFALLGFFVLDDFMAPPVELHETPAEAAPQREQICSEEELRQMRSGIDACFDELPPNSSDSQKREPDPVPYQSS